MPTTPCRTSWSFSTASSPDSRTPRCSGRGPSVSLRRVAFRRLKKQKLWEHEITDAPLEEIAAVDAPIAADALRGLVDMNSVSPASRAVLILHFQEELPLADVAAILEIPLGTVKSRLAYGLAVLRRQLNDKRSP